MGAVFAGNLWWLDDRKRRLREEFSYYIHEVFSTDRLMHQPAHPQATEPLVKRSGVRLVGYRHDRYLANPCPPVPVLEEAPPIQDRHLKVEEDHIRGLR